MRKENQIDVKAWLWRYSKEKRNVIRLRGEYDELVSIQESVSAVTYDGMPHGSGDNHDLSDLMIMRDRTRQDLEEATARMTAAFLEIQDAISQLDTELMRSIISLRYVKLKKNYTVTSFPEIAGLVGYDESYVTHVHGDALKELRAIIPRVKNHSKKQ